MNSARPLLIIGMLLLSGCTTAHDEAVEPTVPPDVPNWPSAIDWFSSSSAGAPGNRLTLATGDRIIALDEPDSPWTIHVIYGESLENRTELIPSSEPLNIAAAIGPRGPVVVYRSPGEMEYDLVVAELRDGNWIESKLTSNKGEIFGFPAVGGSNTELIVGFPVLASVDGPIYSVIRLSSSVPTSLNDAERIDFGVAPLMAPLSSLGDLVVKGNSIAISYTKDLSFVNIHQGTWEYLRTSEPIAIQGPTPSGFSQGLYSSLAMREDSEISVAITEWPLVGGTSIDPRPAVVHEISSGNRVNLNTGNQVDVWLTKNSIIATLTDQNDVHHIGLIEDDFTEIAHSGCTRIAVLENGILVTLGREEGRWVSGLGSISDDVPTCQVAEQQS